MILRSYDFDAVITDGVLCVTAKYEALLVKKININEIMEVLDTEITPEDETMEEIPEEITPEEITPEEGDFEDG